MSGLPALPEDRAARRVGTVLAGKYGIERLLGVGGMASVYAGVHRNGRRVAIKLLHQELGIVGDIRARFVREGYVANAVGHPGAVHVHDDDVDEDGAVFLVMELLDGETLADRSRRRGGALPCREVLALAHQLLDVLAAAHARGVVHRDIKPENLFLTTEGVLKVLDFGVARMRDDASAHVTVTGARIGTPAFMPPEQALGRTAEIDARTDVWAAGATMFTLLAGRTVHTAPSAAELIVITATTPARSLAEHAPDVPPEIVAVVDRALAFSRDDRWPDARSMQRALGEACLAAFGEALDPAAVGPLPPVRPTVPLSENERETLPYDAAQAPTLPTPPALPRHMTPRTTRPSGPPRSSRTTDPARLPSSSRSSDPALEPTDVSSPPPRSSPLDSLRCAPVSSSVRSSSPGLPSTAEEPRSSASGRFPESAAAPAAPRRARWPWIAAALVAVAGASFGIARFTAGAAAPSSPSGAGTAAIPAGESSAHGAAPPGACVKNTDCHSPGPSICRKEDGVCVALETAQCKVLASPGDVENDATIWIGAMFPTSMAPARYGPLSGNAVDLARRDFVSMTGGLLPVRPGAPKRPIGVVLCDDREAPEPAARHLVMDVRVPAILGFALSKEVMELSTSLFIPRGVLVLAANTATSLRELPRSASGQRLVWRVTTSVDMNIPALAALLAGVVEPELRAEPGLLAPGEPIRMALVRVANPSGQSYADSVSTGLRFNGKSVIENGDHFRQFQSNADFEIHPEDDARVAAQIAEYAPQVILHVGSEALPIAIERAWLPSTRHRPRHISPSGYVDPSVLSWVREHPEFRRRYRALDAASPPELVSRYVLHYNETFTPPMSTSDSVSAPYDAFYLFAYAAAALGSEPITGPALAGAIPRLLPGGTPIDVGSGGIYKALYTLAEGKNIDLRGVMTTLDFDLHTGDATVDYSERCLSTGSAAEPPRMVPSGLYFRPALGKLDGASRCP